MPNIVGVRFKKACKIYYFDPADTGAEKGKFVIVETARGKEYGEVVLGPREVPPKQLKSPLKPIIRCATPEDEAKLNENRIREKEAFNICERRIQRHGLEMHLVDVEFTFDVNKIIFYFTAEGRIDFRELVKDLASVFRTRIELRQIGVRDEARMIGGVGVCGRPLCCATFLADFEPVSIRMAKNQNLSLNPSNISGVCGRLMCCLKYEDHMYTKAKRRKKRERERTPVVGDAVATAMGDGKVVSVNKNKHTAAIEISPGNVQTLEWDEIVSAEEANER